MFVFILSIVVSWLLFQSTYRDYINEQKQEFEIFQKSLTCYEFNENDLKSKEEKLQRLRNEYVKCKDKYDSKLSIRKSEIETEVNNFVVENINYDCNYLQELNDKIKDILSQGL